MSTISQEDAGRMEIEAKRLKWEREAEEIGRRAAAEHMKRFAVGPI